MAQAQVMELAEQSVLELPLLGEDEGVVQARDQQDPLDPIQHEILEAAQVHLRPSAPQFTGVDYHPGIEAPGRRAGQTCLPVCHTTPWSIIESATLRKPAMLAPLT